ncbi:hypothetical protein SAMD00019534_086280 [Acytostelium subglobosum LB1]|uniref:hypothetical protein n=1 Tax=Acytostelium subglobosum LB1 TaxID=1410327 RepID=UPI00064518F5|nr:hypothetical protein SAMD00019534_086280 [Acytostelium subglobosum LB1]GAM25453.1 hypothetical protein SAMD00019534_086280 [Acytostelium subglobosum LB1]|eukprot:XP_012751439.1 hypothetical protein SAMD00019534_086280 [Acytostelium subglobosum LB1]
MDLIITSGWLKKWGSRDMDEKERNLLDRSCSGSGYQSSLPSLERVGSLKQRWFILQTDFLSYFDRQPKDVNDMTCMKGQIFLRGCKLKHGGIITPIYQHWSIGMAPPNNKTWKDVETGDVDIDSIALVTPNGVEFTFMSCIVGSKSDMLKDLENWAYSLSYAIHLADKVKEDPVMGWLLKRGEKGHYFKNTKRRWCQLQGNKLRYFTAPPHNNKITTLKGIIDLTHLSEMSDKMLTQIRGRTVTVLGDPGWSNDDSDCFGSGDEGPIEEVKQVNGISLLIDNEREFVLLFDSQEDRLKWLSSITNAVERTYTAQNVAISTSSVTHQPDKQAILTGWLRKTRVNKWWERRYCTLTPTSLIYYKEDPPQKPLGSIYLLVSSCRVIKQRSLDGLDWCFSLADARGLEYFFNTETKDQMERWIAELKLARKRMIITLLDQGGKVVIPITIGKDCALITIQVKEVIRINSLSNKIACEIPVPNIKTVTVLEENKLEIVFTPIDGETPERRLEIISSNPHGVLQLFKDLFSSQENTIN